MNEKNKSDNISLTDFEQEGVIYEPSSKQEEVVIQKPAPQQQKAKKKVVIEDFNFKFFVTSIGVVAFLLLVTTFITLKPYVDEFLSPTKNTQVSVDTSYNNIFPSKNDTSLNDSSNSNSSDLFVATSKEATGMITEINYTDQILKITDLVTNVEYLLKPKIATAFQDKYGNTLSFQELKTGDIVDFSYDADGKLNFLVENNETFKIEGIVPSKVETRSSTIQLNNTVYSIYKNALVTKNGEPALVSDLSTETKITVSGYKNIIINIDIEISTGMLILENKPTLTNAYIAIDRDFYKPLDAIDKVELQEGTHTIIITSSETNQFTREIEIIAGEDYILNLQDVENKSGILVIRSNVSDYRLYIDDEQISTDEAISLKYGKYALKVEKEAYESYETEINISGSQNYLDVTLKKFDQLGTLSISSNPDGAEIFIDNVFVGYSPLTYKLPYGNHHIRLVKGGYNDFELADININENDANFNVTMHSNVTETTTQQLIITTTEATTETTTQATTQTTTTTQQTTEAVTETTTETTTEATTEEDNEENIGEAHTIAAVSNGSDGFTD